MCATWNPSSASWSEVQGICLTRILAVSDEVREQLIDARTAGSLEPVDLILGCGDLPADYLDRLAVRYRAPLLFVRGNHDPPGRQGGYPEGAEIDGRLVQQDGLLVAGLEGSRRYSEGPHQYREWEMMTKVVRLRLRLRGRRPDILITHGPPAGIHDGKDLAHQGLSAIRRALDWIKPRYLLHGHVHPYSNLTERETGYGPTRVINVVGYRLLEISPRALQVPA